MLRDHGLFAFTTRVASPDEVAQRDYVQQTIGGFEIFSHAPAYLESLLAKYAFRRSKTQRIFIGEDVFALWVVREQ